MKKYMFIAVAALMFAGIANAQSSGQPGKKMAPKHTTAAKPAQPSSTTASVSPKTEKTTGAASTTGIKRKHHAKKHAAKTPATK